MKYLKTFLIVFTLLASLLLTGSPASASSSVTIIEFQGFQTCEPLDMTPYMTILPSGNIQVKNFPSNCTNTVYDVKTGALVTPLSITHIGYLSALLNPDWTGQIWGDCPGSGWQAHFEGTWGAAESVTYMHGTGEKGGPFEGMMFQMHGVANDSTGWVTMLSGQIIIPNDN